MKRFGGLGLVLGLMVLMLVGLVLMAPGPPPAVAQGQGDTEIAVLDAGASAYTADHNSSYETNRYWSEVDVFVSVDVSATADLAPTIQHSPDGSTWYNGTAFTTITTDSTTFSMERAAWYGEFLRVNWDLTGSNTFTPTVKVVSHRPCEALEVEVLDAGATAYTVDHNSTYKLDRHSGFVDVFVTADVSSTATLVPTIQHSPDGNTWYDGTAFTTITTDSTTFDMNRSTLYGEFVRVEWDLTGSNTYTPTVKAVFHKGCDLSGYESLRADRRLDNDAAADIQTRTQADSRFVNVTGDTMTGALMVDGSADAVQLTVQGHSSQTAKPLVIETSAGTDKFTVDNSGNVVAAGTMDVTGAGTFANDVTVDDTFNIDDTSWALTGTQTLTPTASMYVVGSTGAVTITLATGSAAAGDFLWLVANTAQAIVIVDTTATAGGANRTLGNHDVIGFLFDGSIWVEAFYSDNS